MWYEFIILLWLDKTRVNDDYNDDDGLKHAYMVYENQPTQLLLKKKEANKDSKNTSSMMIQNNNNNNKWIKKND